MLSQGMTVGSAGELGAAIGVPSAFVFPQLFA